MNFEFFYPIAKVMNTIEKVSVWKVKLKILFQSQLKCKFKATYALIWYEYNYISIVFCGFKLEKELADSF